MDRIQCTCGKCHIVIARTRVKDRVHEDIDYKDKPMKGGGFITSGNKIVLVQTGNLTWGLPKGSAEDSDPSIAHTAQREIQEETGLEIPIDHTRPDISSSINDNFKYVLKGKNHYYKVEIPDLTPDMLSKNVATAEDDVTGIALIDFNCFSALKCFNYDMRKLFSQYFQTQLPGGRGFVPK